MTVEQILNALRRAAANDYPWSVSPQEASALVAEVDRLRAQVAELRALGVSLHKAADAGAKNERAAVVAWLRECALDPEATGAEMRLFQGLATTIERREHRRGEKE